MDVAPARAAALAMLARREHSAHELQTKLKQKGFAAAVVEAVVTALQSQRLLSDVRFAEALATMRRRRGFGPLYIAQELRRKGVSDALIAEVVDTQTADWRALLREVRCKKFGVEPPKTAAETAKQIRFLQQRGFAYEQIRQVLNSQDDY